VAAEYELLTVFFAGTDCGVDEHADTSPNIVIVKEKIPIKRAGCAIIDVTLTRGIPTPYGTEP
jgi:hypothetical protein